MNEQKDHQNYAKFLKAYTSISRILETIISKFNLSVTLKQLILTQILGYLWQNQSLTISIYNDIYKIIIGEKHENDD